MIEKTLQREILNLKVLEKIHLIEFILESLDKSDTEIELKWSEESEKRFDAYKAGKLKAAFYNDVMKRFEV